MGRLERRVGSWRATMTLAQDNIRYSGEADDNMTPAIVGKPRT
ncbi:hypothetical protein [Dictyobacter vulcani]|nr:hypothetical protein [Dictyobacter vulcani]